MTDIDPMILRVRTGIATANVVALAAATDEAMAAFRETVDIKFKLLAVYATAGVTMIEQDEPTAVIDELDATVARLGVIAAA